MPRGNPQYMKPIKPGEIRNPWGRAGKKGTGGFSMLEKFRQHLEHLEKVSPTDIQMIWNGLIEKAKTGDPKCIELIVKLNGEKIEQEKEINETNNSIIIQMPPQDAQESR